MFWGVSANIASLAKGVVTLVIFWWDFFGQKRSIVNNVAIYKAQLTQKSLSNQHLSRIHLTNLNMSEIYTFCPHVNKSIRLERELSLILTCPVTAAFCAACFGCLRSENCTLVMGAFEALLRETSKLCELFVSKQWFGARIKLPKSCDFSKRGFITS